MSLLRCSGVLMLGWLAFCSSIQESPKDCGRKFDCVVQPPGCARRNNFEACELAAVVKLTKGPVGEPRLKVIMRAEAAAKKGTTGLVHYFAIFHSVDKKLGKDPGELIIMGKRKIHFGYLTTSKRSSFVLAKVQPVKYESFIHDTNDLPDGKKKFNCSYEREVFSNLTHYHLPNDGANLTHFVEFGLMKEGTFKLAAAPITKANYSVNVSAASDGPSSTKQGQQTTPKDHTVTTLGRSGCLSTWQQDWTKMVVWTAAVALITKL